MNCNIVSLFLVLNMIKMQCTFCHLHCSLKLLYKLCIESSQFKIFMNFLVLLNNFLHVLCELFELFIVEFYLSLYINIDYVIKC